MRPKTVQFRYKEFHTDVTKSLRSDREYSFLVVSDRNIRSCPAINRAVFDAYVRGRRRFSQPGDGFLLVFALDESLFERRPDDSDHVYRGAQTTGYRARRARRHASRS
jgi:hypothetical protein